jgi:hypothetical protein
MRKSGLVSTRNDCRSDTHATLANLLMPSGCLKLTLVSAVTRTCQESKRPLAAGVAEAEAAGLAVLCLRGRGCAGRHPGRHRGAAASRAAAAVQVRTGCVQAAQHWLPPRVPIASPHLVSSSATHI